MGLLWFHLHICRAELACDVSLAGGGGFGYDIAADRHKNGHITQVSESRNRRQIWLHSGVLALAVQDASLKADHAFVRRLKDRTSSIEPARSAQLHSGAKRSQLTGISCPLIRLSCPTPVESA